MVQVLLRERSVSNDKREIPDSFASVILKEKSEHVIKERMREAVPRSLFALRRRHRRGSRST